MRTSSAITLRGRPEGVGAVPRDDHEAVASSRQVRREIGVREAAAIHRAHLSPGRLLVQAAMRSQSSRKTANMSIMRFALAVLLSGIVLAGAGCGDSDQSDGQLVTPTEDVIKSRAAVEKAYKERPNMYAPTKGGQEKRR
jgi:hypothetical protein